MYRSHNCGELRVSNIGEEITLSGWVQTVRNKGGLIWIDLRDRYGITQLVLEEGVSSNKSIAYLTLFDCNFPIICNFKFLKVLLISNHLLTAS